MLVAMGCYPAMLETLQNQGADFILHPDQLIVKQKDGTKFKFEVFLSVLQAAAKNKNDPATIELKNKLDAFFSDVALGALDPGTSTEFTATEIAAPESKSLFAPPPIAMPKQWLDHLNAMTQHAPLSPKGMEFADKLPLANAKGLYAPVRGSDATSRYFLVAVFPTYKVAARIKGFTFSIRIEGNVPEKDQLVFVSMGIKHNAPGHWSAHLVDIKSVEQAQKYLGALLGALGGALTPMPDLGTIQHAGW